MAEVRSADVTWTGSLAEGSGMINNVTSGAFAGLPVSWGSRTGAPDGRTSPEELIASAHAACFSMSFAGRLTRNGTPPASLSVRATVTFDKDESGWRIASSALTVRGVVPGIDAATFRSLAEGARDGCPVSVMMHGNVALSVDATLEG